MLNAFARLELRDLGLFQRAADAISTFQRPGERALALFTHAYAKMAIADSELFRRLALELTSLDAGELSLQSATQVGQAYARVAFRDMAVFRAVASAAERTAGDATPGQIAQLLHAFAEVTPLLRQIWCSR